MKHTIIFGLILTIISQQIVATNQTGQEKSIICAGCHGPTGVSINPEWPNLAGQHARYLIKQLQDYKQAKTRNVPLMTAMVAQLSDDDIEALSDFYASQPIPKGKTPKQYAARGEALYRRGDLNKHITACIACHGPRGTGSAEAGFPVLSGQQAAYTVSQLQAFQEKKRSNDLNSIMRNISSHMNLDDMKAVAYYLAGLDAKSSL